MSNSKSQSARVARKTIVTGEGNVQSNHISSAAAEKEFGATMTTNNSNNDYAYFVKGEFSDVFVNEPITLDEATGERKPIREGMVGGVLVRLYENLNAYVGSYQAGVRKFVKSIRTYEQIVGLLGALESFAEGKGTFRHGVHSHYELSDLKYVEDRVNDFFYVKFSEMSKADLKLFASLGIKDDGQHEKRWVSLYAQKGKLGFGYIVHPFTGAEYIEHMKSVYSEENRQISLERDNKDRRVVTGYNDITRLDWKNDFGKRWSQQHRHDGIEDVLNVLDGKTVLRVAPALYEKSDGSGLSAQEKAQFLAERFTTLFEGVESIVSARKERGVNRQARESILGTVHVLSNPDKYGVKVADEVTEAIGSGKIEIVKNGKVMKISADKLVSDRRGNTVFLAIAYRNGTTAIQGKFSVYSVDELTAALQRATKRDMLLSIVG